jgi:hypothetical protein
MNARTPHAHGAVALTVKFPGIPETPLETWGLVVAIAVSVSGDRVGIRRAFRADQPA